jgi:hypothetical protein
VVKELVAELGEEGSDVAGRRQAVKTIGLVKHKVLAYENS